MDDDVEAVGLLLRRAADAAGEFAPPAAGTLIRRGHREQRLRALSAVAASVTAVAIVAAGLAIAQGSSPRSAPPSRLQLTAPTGPKVSAAALSGYRWSALPAAPIAPRSGSATAWTGRVMLVWGGADSTESMYNDGAAYDPSTRSWTTLPPSPLDPRARPASAFVDGRLVVWGGTLNPSGTLGADGATYDVAHRRWVKMPPAPVTSYGWAQLVAAGSRVVLLTTPTDPAQAVVRADVYDPPHNSWRSLPDLQTPAHQELDRATALSVGGTVLLWRYWAHDTVISSNAQGIEIQGAGGVDTHALDVDRGQWSDIPLGMSDHDLVDAPIWTGDRILVPVAPLYCGHCTGGPARLTIPGLVIDPRTGRQSAIPGGPVSGSTSSFVWTGAALVGINLSTSAGRTVSPGDTAVWDPDTDRWTSLPSIASGPDGIQTSTILWAGDRVLVWGLTSPRGPTPPANAGLELAPVG